MSRPIWNRRRFLKSLSRTAVVLPFSDVLLLAMPPWARAESASQQTMGSERAYETKPMPPPPGAASPIAGTPLGVSFVDVAAQSGLNAKTIFGGEGKNKYLLETTGCGLAFYDYDQDGWLDLFLVNGWRLEGFPAGHEPTCHLFKNNRDGTFTDVTAKAGLARSGWGQGCCVGDYDNDGWDDLFVSYYGQNALFRNQRRRHLLRRDRQSRPHPVANCAGTPAAPFSTTTATATSTSSSATTSTSI